MKFQILLALLQKEIALMKRNPIIPKIVFAMPVMVMLAIPLVANLDVKNVSVAIVDNDHSQLSRRTIADIAASEFLDVSSVCNTHSEAMSVIENGNADALLTIPPSYSETTMLTMPQVDVEANGINATKGMIGSQYVAQAVAGTLSRWYAENGIELPRVNQSVIYRFNPTLDFRN